MKNSAFLAFVLLVFAGLVAAHALIRETVSPAKVLSERLARVEKEKKEAELRERLATYQLLDFQQQVATLIPNALPKGKWDDPESYPLRRLASVVTSTDELVIERASGLFERAKKAFRDKKYGEANRLLENLIEDYPQSTHVIESHFLLAEGQFQLKEYEASIATVEKMVSVFPDSELTGFALLRLGRIFEVQERFEDAADIYRAVLANFNGAELVKQAQSSLKAVEL